MSSPTSFSRSSPVGDDAGAVFIVAALLSMGDGLLSWWRRLESEVPSVRSAGREDGEHRSWLAAKRQAGHNTQSAKRGLDGI